MAFDEFPLQENAMEGELWKRLYHLLERLGKGWHRKAQQYSDVWVLAVYLWAVVHDRPVSWACDARNWPGDMISDLPSPSRISRRMRTESFIELAKDLDIAARGLLPCGIWKWIDATPLPIGNCSKDRQAGYGRCACGMGKGYKLFAICDSSGAIDAWRLGPMNKGEKTMAMRLLANFDSQGYLTGDSEYDANPLYAAAELSGLRLIADKRGGSGLRHRKHRPGRLRSIELTRRDFGRTLLRERRGIERSFAYLTFGSTALQPLPAWVRTHARVEMWVRGKIIFYHLRKAAKSRLTA